MDDKQRPAGDLPERDPKDIEKQADQSRRELDDIPEPGSDPLHEGP